MIEKIKEIDASDKAFEKALEKFEKENATGLGSDRRSSR